MARESKIGLRPETLKGEELYGIILKARGEADVLPDDAIMRAIWQAEDFYESDLQIRLNPTRVFSDPELRNRWPDASLHVTDFDELVDLEEPMYDWSAGAFDGQKWAMTLTRHLPIRSISKVVLTWPGSVKVWEPHLEHIRLDKFSGELQIVPADRFPINVIALGALLNIISNGRGMPKSLIIDYVGGFTPELLEAHHQDILRGIRLRAALNVFGILSGALSNGGLQSGSLSLDGLSRSRSFGGKFGPYSGAIEFALQEEADIRKARKSKLKPVPVSWA